MLLAEMSSWRDSSRTPSPLRSRAARKRLPISSCALLCPSAVASTRGSRGRPWRAGATFCSASRFLLAVAPGLMPRPGWVVPQPYTPGEQPHCLQLSVAQMTVPLCSSRDQPPPLQGQRHAETLPHGEKLLPRSRTRGALNHPARKTSGPQAVLYGPGL